MSYSNPTKHLTLSALLLWAPLVLGQAVATTPEAMDRAALTSIKAENATLLAVTRAGSRLVAAGERGIILISDDNGASWRQAKVPTSVNLTALRFVDERRGWAVGHMGIVLHSEDGGLTWRKQLDGVEAARLAVEAVRDSGDKREIKLADYLVSDGPDKPFFDVWMDSQGRGFITGAFNLMFHTDDGGRHWQYWSPRVKNPFGLHLYDITPLGEGFIIAGEQGLLLRSRDGGEHFTPLETPYEGSWFGILATRAGTLLAYGLRGNAYVSHDGGDNWLPCETGGKASFSSAVELDDGRIVLANQAGQLFASSDQGRSFQPLKGLPGLPFASLTQAASGQLILGGLRGLSRIEPIPLAQSN
ncbi:MAG: YCF48-related protein [Candidatus Thiodiazotropha sp.]